MEDTDRLKKESGIEQKQNGGAREGAGRPKGSENKQTREKNAAAKLFRARVAKNADRLFNAQVSIATGTQVLFVVHTDSKGVRRKPEMITDIETISRFLDENEGEDGTMDNGQNTTEDYYYMTTMQPNNMAIEGMLNRAFGRAKESIDLTSGDEPINSRELGEKELNERIENFLLLRRQNKSD